MACFALRVKRFTGRAKHWARDAQPIDLHDIRDPADHIAEPSRTVQACWTLPSRPGYPTAHRLQNGSD